MQTFPIRIFENILVDEEDSFILSFEDFNEFYLLNLRKSKIEKIQEENKIFKRLPEVSGVWLEPIRIDPNIAYFYFLNGKDLTRFSEDERSNFLPFITNKDSQHSKSIAIYNSIILYQRLLKNFNSNKPSLINGFKEWNHVINIYSFS